MPSLLKLPTRYVRLMLNDNFAVFMCVQTVYGVKGRSVLTTLVDFDVINNNPVDYMHCVLLGVVRTFLSWFDSKHHKEQWSVNQYM